MIAARILGCGSSGGIPRLGGNWGDCDPLNPKNRRRRCSLLVRREGPDGITQVLIDTGPDMVPQLLDAGVGRLDGVVYTHGHADHVHGIDDLRQIVFNMRSKIAIWADAVTGAQLQDRFGYIFQTPEGSGYPPIGELHRIDGPFRIDGPGGALTLTPFVVRHGEIDALGFRISEDITGGLVYLPDVSAIPDAAWPAIEGAELFICDALRRTPHPSHSHLEQTVGWINRSGVERGIITNMHLDMDYEAVLHDTPDHILPAFDGMELTCR